MIDEVNSEGSFVIDAEGVIEFSTALGIAEADMDIPTILASLEELGFLVINPDTLLTDMGMSADDIAMIREDLEALGLDADLILDSIIDPNAAIPFDTILADFDDSSPAEVLAILDEIALVFAEVEVSNDIVKQFEDFEKQIRKDQEKRQKKTKPPKPTVYKFEEKGVDAVSEAGYAELTMPSGGTVFVGLATKTTWSNELIVAHGSGLCGTNNDEMNDYEISIVVTDSDGVPTTYSAVQILSCEYVYKDGDIVKRDDESVELDSKLIKQATSKNQFIGLKDDLQKAMDLVPVADQAGIIVLDKALRPQSDV